MKIQMHKQLEKWAQLFASLNAGNMASPPAQINTKLPLSKEQSWHFLSPGINPSAAVSRQNYGQTGK